MIRFFNSFVFFALTIFFVSPTIANIGCSTYNGLYPNSTSTTNPATGNILYSNTDYIAFRTWDDDPQCGIRSNKIQNASPGGACDVSGVGTYGTLVSYNPEDNNCRSIDAPLDDYVLAILLISGGLGVMEISRKFTIIGFHHRG